MFTPPPRIRPAGDELFTGMTETRMLDFWRFALPNLQMNNVRGWFAEFLVVRAVGIEAPIRIEWDDYDVVWGDIHIEVKASGRLQAWDQAKLSTVTFSGLSARTWTPDEGRAAERSYKADVYVFAVQTAETHDDYDPLDIDQWRFAVLPVTAVAATGRRSLGWAAVRNLAGGDITFAELRDDIAVKAASGRAWP